MRKTLWGYAEAYADEISTHACAAPAVCLHYTCTAVCMRQCGMCCGMLFRRRPAVQVRLHFWGYASRPTPAKEKPQGLPGRPGSKFGATPGLRR